MKITELMEKYDVMIFSWKRVGENDVSILARIREDFSLGHWASSRSLIVLL